MDSYVGVLKQYAVFGGRARRREYWMFALFNFLIVVVLTVVDEITGMTSATDGAGVLATVYGLAVLLPSLAVAVRRLHDVNRSGGWIFIVLVPIVGIVILIVFLASEGQLGDNRYGSDPKALSVGAVAPSVAAGWYRGPNRQARDALLGFGCVDKPRLRCRRTVR